MREHAPPPVQIELGRGRMARVLVSALAALAAAAGAAWWAQPGAAAAVPLAAALAWRLARPATGRLRWDGAAWCWQAGGHDALGRAQIMLDLGDALVLRFVPLADGPAHWWWLGRREAGPAWHGLRVALVQQRRAAAAVV